MAKDDDLALVARLMRRVRTQHAWPAIIVTAGSLVGMLIWPGVLTRADALGGDDYTSVLFWVIIGATLLVNAAMWALAWPSLRVETSPMYLALRDAPASAIWVFGGSTTLSISGIALPNPEQSITICLADGRSGSLRFIPPRQLEAVSAAVLRLAPHARTGFTAENRAYYEQAVRTRR